MRLSRAGTRLGVALALLTSMPALWAYTLSFAGDLSGSPGSLATVAVAVDDANGLSAASFDVNYDPAVLAHEGAAPGTLSAGWVLDVGTPAPGTTAVAVFGLDDLGPGGGTLVALDFRVLGPAGASSPLSLTAVDLGGSGGSVPAGLITLDPGTFAAVPLPASGLLLAFALAPLARLRRRGQVCGPRR